jgi:cell division protein FtsB
MSAPRKRFVPGRWVDTEAAPSLEPVVVDRRLYAVLHHLNARVTSLEQQIAALTNSAPAPKKRTRSQPSA